MEKKEVKKHYREMVLQELKMKDSRVREVEEEILTNKLVSFIKENNYKKIAFYYGVFPELNTSVIFQELTFTSLYLPRMLPNRQLAFHLFEEDKLETVWNKIQQPTDDTPTIRADDLDLIIVPGLAFMPNGYRIGFGGGYYDRFLEKLNVMTVSVVFPQQVFSNNEWQVDAFDIPIQKLITI